MALIDCPECGKQISSEAYGCPNCGYPTERQKKLHFSWKRTVLLWAALIIAFLATWQFFSMR